MEVLGIAVTAVVHGVGGEDGAGGGVGDAGKGVAVVKRLGYRPVAP